MAVTIQDEVYAYLNRHKGTKKSVRDISTNTGWNHTQVRGALKNMVGTAKKGRAPAMPDVRYEPDKSRAWVES